MVETITMDLVQQGDEASYAARQLNQLNGALDRTVTANNLLGRSMRQSQQEFRQSQRLSTQFGNSLFGIATGATSARSALSSILNSAARSVLSGSFNTGRSRNGSVLSTIFSGLFNADGNAFAGGKVVPFANGGVVSSPSIFPMAGGKTGVMGEAGAEAIMPLRRMSNGRLGVESNAGAGASSTTVYLDARGADMAAVSRIERALQLLNASVERRAIDAVSNRFDRDPNYIRGR